MEGKKRQIQVLTLVLCLLLVCLNLWQLRQISDLREDLRRTEANLQTETRRLDERIQVVQRAMREADAAVLDWEYTTAVNKEQRVLDVTVDLSLKEWSVDTEVWVNWTSLLDGKTGSEPMRGGKSGRLTGILKLPVGGHREYALEAVIQNGESQRLEDLGYLGDTATLLPVQLAGCGGSSANYTREKDGSGIFDLSFYEVDLQGSKGSGPPEVKDAVFRLRRNGDVTVEQTAKYGETIENYTCDPEKGLIAEAGMGDEFTLSFFCRDTSGLGYEFDLEQWSIGESGIAREHGPEDFWPTLTWD